MGKIKKIRMCRECGCTDKDCRRCVEAQGFACRWVGPNLCSRCQVELVLRRPVCGTLAGIKQFVKFLPADRIFAVCSAFETSIDDLAKAIWERKKKFRKQKRR